MNSFTSDSYHIPKPLYELPANPYDQPPSFSYSEQNFTNRYSPPKPKIVFDRPFSPQEKGFSDPCHNPSYLPKNLPSYELPHELYELPKKSQFSPKYEEIPRKNENSFPYYENPYKYFEMPKKSQFSPKYEEIPRKNESPNDVPIIKLEYPIDNLQYFTLANPKPLEYFPSEPWKLSDYYVEKPKKHESPKDVPIIRLEYPIYDPRKKHESPKDVPIIRLEYPTDDLRKKHESPKDVPIIRLEYPIDDPRKKHESPLDVPIIRLEYPIDDPRNSDYFKESTKRSHFINNSDVFTEIPVRKEDPIPKITNDDRPFSNVLTMEIRDGFRNPNERLNDMDEKCNDMYEDMQELKNSLHDRLKLEQNMQDRNRELENEVENLRSSMMDKPREDKLKKATKRPEEEEVFKLKTQINILQEELEKEREEPKKNAHLIKELYDKICGFSNDLSELDAKTQGIENDLANYRQQRKDKKQNRLNLLNNMIDNLKKAKNYENMNFI